MTSNPAAQAEQLAAIYGRLAHLLGNEPPALADDAPGADRAPARRNCRSRAAQRRTTCGDDTPGRGDYTQRVAVGDGDSLFDALAAGLNTLTEELQASQQERKHLQEQIIQPRWL